MSSRIENFDEVLIVMACKKCMHWQNFYYTFTFGSLHVLYQNMTFTDVNNSVCPYILSSYEPWQVYTLSTIHHTTFALANFWLTSCYSSENNSYLYYNYLFQPRILIIVLKKIPLSDKKKTKVYPMN